MLNENEFYEKLVSLIKAELPRCDVSLKENEKNNVSEIAMIITGKQMRCSPVFALKAFYDEYCMNDNLDEIVSKIIDYYVDQIEQSKNVLKQFDELNSYERVRNLLGIKMVNYESNKDGYIKDAAYKKFLDLAIVPYISLEMKDGIGSCVVNNHMLKIWNKTIDEVIEDALSITKKDYEIMDLSKMLEMMMPGFFDGKTDLPKTDDMTQMIVVTNHNKINGAWNILNEEALQNVCEKIGDNKFYIIPSSIHEIICVPVCNQPGYFKEMIRTVNMESVDPKDILSNTLYLYDDGDVKIA